MSKKLDELNGIAAFGVVGKVDGQDVSPQTAMAILLFYGKLNPQMKRQYLTMPVERMKQIAYVQTGGMANQGIPLTPEGKMLVDFAKKAYAGEQIFAKKYAQPFVENVGKNIDKFLNKRKNPLLDEK